MSDDLWSRALALPPAQRAELAHALMDSLYEEVDWDTGPGWHIVPDPSIADLAIAAPEISGVPPTVAEIVDLEQRRSSPKRA